MPFLYEAIHLRPLRILICDDCVCSLNELVLCTASGRIQRLVHVSKLTKLLKIEYPNVVGSAFSLNTFPCQIGPPLAQ